jgi:hypothetical protein
VGTLSFDPPQTASVTAEQVSRLGNIIRNTSLVPCLVDVPDGTSVYLVVARLIQSKRIGLGFHDGGQDQEPCRLTPYCGPTKGERSARRGESVPWRT